MDAISYIRIFRDAYEARDHAAARCAATQLREEQWPTVALTCSRLMGLGSEATDETRWHGSHLGDVLLEAHTRQR